MKRFYKEAQSGTAPGGFVVRLDGKLLKTPLKNNLIFQHQDLADAIAAEWNAQGSELIPAKMPLTQLANTMVDKGAGPDRVAMNAELLRYAGSDLVCYFATHPADLVQRQEQQWLPLVNWMKSEYGVVFKTIQGIQYIHQSDESLVLMKKIIDGLDAPSFTVVQAATGMTGSVTIALALLCGRIDAEGAYQAACVDEIYQLEKWGEDAQARKKLDHLRAELSTVEFFSRLMRVSL